MDLSDCRRILIIKLSSIGDVVMATPVAKALRTAFPEAYLAWVVEEKSKDVVVGNPYLDETIVWERNSVPPGGFWLRTQHVLRTFGELVGVLRSKSFDVAIDLQGLLRSAIVAWASGARYRVGFDGSREGAWLFYSHRQHSVASPKIHGPQHYLNALKPLGINSTDVTMCMPITDDDRAFARKLIAELCGGGSAEIAALCPATTWPNKHWTEEAWAVVADKLLSEWGLFPVFLGATPDIPKVERICSLAHFKPASAAGRTTLKQAGALLELSKLVIGVDTGLLHMAVALDRPTIGVFGPSGWRNFVRKDNFIFVAKDFPCIPCYRHPACKHYDCMRAISPEDVLSAVGRLLVTDSVGSRSEKG